MLLTTDVQQRETLRLIRDVWLSVAEETASFPDDRTHEYIDAIERIIRAIVLEFGTTATAH
jgi:hypothetical protein